MNPRNLILVFLILALASCGTSSNFQKRKFLNLKALSESKTEMAEVDNSDLNDQTSSIIESEELEKTNLSEHLSVPNQIQDYIGSPKFDEDEPQGKEDREKLKVVEEKSKELFEPLEADKLEEQKKGVIFASIAAGLYILGIIASFLLFIELLSPFVGGIIIGLIIAAIVVFSILAIVNGYRAMKGKKETVWHWASRIGSFSAGIILCIGAGILLGNLIFTLLFL